MPNEAASRLPFLQMLAGAMPARDESDAELMERSIQGDRASYGALFARHADRIWRMAYLLLHHAEAADDIAQETFTRGLEHIRSYRGEAPPRAWFSSISINLCRHYLRDEHQEPNLANAEALEHGRRLSRPRTRGVLTNMIRRERNRKLALALGYLTWPQREVFVLHYVDEMPYEEIAQLLGITPGAARALAHRAKGVLREKLGSDLKATL